MAGSVNKIRKEQTTGLVPYTGADANLDMTGQTITADDFVGAVMDSEINANVKTLTLPASTTISTFGASLIDDADASTARSTLGLAIGSNVQAYDADLTTWAGLTPSANAQSLVTAVDYSAMRTLLGLVIGTNVQAYDAQLDTWATVTPSANGQSLVASANYASMRGLLDLEAGTDFYSISATDTLLTAKAPLASPSFTGTVTLPTGLTGALRADSGVVSVDGTVIRKVKSSDEIVNNSSVLQNDDDLFFSVGANEIWAVRMYVKFSSPATPDIKFQWSLPSGATGFVTGEPYYDGNSFTGTSSFTFTGSSGTTRNLIFQGYIETAGTSGTAQFQWAQNTQDASDTTVFAYSYLIAEKLA